jgi:transcriptional regulator with XRE-family HTH domain
VVEQLREAIRKDGRSLNQIGKLSGVDAARLSRFLRGKRDLTFEAVEKVCRLLGLVLTPYGPGETPPAPTDEAK